MHVFEPEIFEPVVFGVGDVSSIGNSAPCIKGHISGTDSSFTFQVNGSDVTVSVSGGNWKYKPTATITSIAFVGVPQLESLELDNITGVSTFNLDYPVVPTFKNCDATTEAALNYVYHIRGTATADFTFTLIYKEGDTTAYKTETATIDNSGNWDVAYSGKKISSLQDTFKLKTAVTAVTFTEDCAECTTIYGCFTDAANCVSADFPYAIFPALTSAGYLLNRAYLLERLAFPSATFSSLSTVSGMFNNATSLVNFIINADGTLASGVNISACPLSYDSMLNVAGWLKNIKGSTALTVTFRKATYDALTAEQQAALTAIIVTEKGWNLATA